LRGNHGSDLRVVSVKLHFVDAREELFQVGLDDDWILSLAQNFKQIIVSQKVESGKLLALFFQEVV